MTSTSTATDFRHDQALPSYRELPEESGGARSAWGLFGVDDSVGLMNLITPAVTASAAQLATTGAVFPLDVPTGFVAPAFFDRGLPRHTLIQRRPGSTFDDVYDNVYPQAGSQWDSLAHVAARPDGFYNGATRAQIAAGERNTIEHWGRRGIATRGILLDVSEAVAARGGPSASVAVTVDDLEAARRRAGVEYRPGDILLINTGFLSWYGTRDRDFHTWLAKRENLASPGLDRSEEMAEYIWNAHAVGVASDVPGLEVWPGTGDGSPYSSLHRIFIGLFGLGIGELWWLDDLATHCRALGRYEVFLTSAPWNNPGAIGSTPNALAIM